MFILLPVICIFIDLGLSIVYSTFRAGSGFLFDEQKHVKFCIKNCNQ